MPVGQRHGFGGRLEHGLEEVLSRLGARLRLAAFGDFTVDDQDRLRFTAAGRLQADLGFPVAHAFGPGVREVQRFAESAGENAIKAGHPLSGDGLGCPDLGDRFSDERFRRSSVGTLYRRIHVEKAPLTVIARNHVGQVAGQGLEVPFAVVQGPHGALQAPCAVPHRKHHQQGQQARTGQQGLPGRQNTFGAQGIDNHEALRIAREPLVADDALDAIHHRSGPEHPRWALVQGRRQVPMDLHALFPLDERVPAQHRGGTVVLDPEQAHAAVLGHAFGRKPCQQRLACQLQFVEPAAFCRRLTPDHRNDPLPVVLSRQAWQPLAFRRFLVFWLYRQFFQGERKIQGEDQWTLGIGQAGTRST